MATDIGNRKSLSADLVKSLKRQFQKLQRQDISAYTFERHNSHYPDAKADLSVYDSLGTHVIVGREFGGRQTLFWESATPIVDKR